jgi:hypothetical protein
MQATAFPSLAEEVRKLPSEGARRDRQVHRIIDTYAAAEAVAALHGAAERARIAGGFVATVLTSAEAILEDGASLGDARDVLRAAVTSSEFQALLPVWMRELREGAAACPDTGACTVATALRVWSWSMQHLRATPQAIDELIDTLCPLLAARSLALESQGSAPVTEASLRRDLSHVYAARVSALAGATCAELVFGYRRHLVWDAEGCEACYAADELDDLEAMIPGMASGARTTPDVIEADGSHAAKEGPCVRFDGVDTFMKMRNRLDGCLTGARIAKDRAAAAIVRATLNTLEGNA